MLRITLSKLTAYRSFWRFLATYTVAIPAIFYAGSNILEFSIENTALPFGQWFQLPQAWQTVTALSRFLLFIPAFFIIQLVCAEVDLRLVRAHVASGLDRHEIIACWVLTNVLQLAVGSIVSLMTVALLANGASPAAGWKLTTILLPQVGNLIYGLTFLNLAMLIGLIMRRPVPAIGVLMLWPMMIERLVGYVMSRNSLDRFVMYLPFEAMAKLVSLPQGDITVNVWGTSSWVVIAYCLLFTALAWGRLRQMDL